MPTGGISAANIASYLALKGEIATFTAPVSSGTCPMTAHFDGDATYDIGQGLANLTVLRRPTAVALEDAVSRAKDVFVTTATLVDVLKGTVIDTVSLPVRVEYSTQTATGSTSAGKAQVAFVAAATSGTYRMDAWYDGNGTYDTCQSSATLTVIRRDTALAMKDMKTILNEVFRATGTLTDAATGTAVGERPLKPVFITTETVKTDTYGVATATFTAAIPVRLPARH
jgi:hypothetical protein